MNTINRAAAFIAALGFTVPANAGGPQRHTPMAAPPPAVSVPRTPTMSSQQMWAMFAARAQAIRNEPQRLTPVEAELLRTCKTSRLGC